MLTSINLEESQYKEFKVDCFNNKINLTNFVDTCIKFFLSESQFRDKIVNKINYLQISGSLL
ncbi:MAG TPA: hypothetical protein DC057_08690 [Spirochaetia bacterium]|nr:hypothetical protein [Spirochaetia bacterium]